MAAMKSTLDENELKIKADQNSSNLVQCYHEKVQTDQTVGTSFEYEAPKIKNAYVKIKNKATNIGMPHICRLIF